MYCMRLSAHTIYHPNNKKMVASARIETTNLQIVSPALPPSFTFTYLFHDRQVHRPSNDFLIAGVGSRIHWSFEVESELMRSEMVNDPDGLGPNVWLELLAFLIKQVTEEPPLLFRYCTTTTQTKRERGF